MTALSTKLSGYLGAGHVVSEQPSQEQLSGKTKVRHELSLDLGAQYAHVDVTL